MTIPDPDEMEEFQRMSDKYQPELPGPLIGEKLPMSDLVQEYARADSTYIAKTHALAGSYIFYRRVKGDGQCGWRGAVFRYFEIVAESNLGFVQQENIRMQSFGELMKMAGVAYELLEDFFNQTWDLFGEILNAIGKGEPALPLVAAAFNDEERSNGIVYHFKMMTSSYMALHADDFEPFLEMPLDQYRQARIDPTNQEIDQIGLQALSTGVIQPAGFAVEVLYLDRSAGDEVTPHEFIPGGDKKPTIRLLYRPGHYDLIYKLDTSDLSIRTATFPQEHVYQQLDDSYLNERYYEYLFPGTQLAPSDPNARHRHDQPPTHYSYQSPPAFAPAPVWDPASMYSAPQYGMSNQQVPVCHPSEVPNQHSRAEYYSPPRDTYEPSPPSNAASTTPDPVEPPIRHSEFSSAIRGIRRVQHANMPLDPRSFGNSSQSRANYTNPDFEPEAWEPRNR